MEETEIVHLGKSFKDDCSLFIQTGKKTHKLLWDSGACKCVLSLESYKMIPDKYKTDLFSSNIKIKAANGTITKNNGEFDIIFRMGTEKFTFPFLCFTLVSIDWASYPFDRQRQVTSVDADARCERALNVSSL